MTTQQHGHGHKGDDKKGDDKKPGHDEAPAKSEFLTLKTALGGVVVFRAADVAAVEAIGADYRLQVHGVTHTIKGAGVTFADLMPGYVPPPTPAPEAKPEDEESKTKK